jgi:hypothetical protein
MPEAWAATGTTAYLSNEAICRPSHSRETIPLLIHKVIEIH